MVIVTKVLTEVIFAFETIFSPVPSQTDGEKMENDKWSVSLLSTVGTAISSCVLEMGQLMASKLAVSCGHTIASWESASKSTMGCLHAMAF
jgi:hypothetical protein